ncbi:MAG TPA: DUF3618 domain-containing protein [Streptosporangiaceae bacterium]|nr:DUF3618 domain-containing protein [Streptosporangiaceae bacterium]
MTADRPTLSMTTEGAETGNSHAAPDQRELQEQIAQARQQLADTVAGLAAKIDPRTRTSDKAEQVKAVTGAQAARVTEQAMRRTGQVRSGARAVADKAREAVAAHPPAGRRFVGGLAVALTAVGIAATSTWLARRGRDRKSRQWGRR